MLDVKSEPTTMTTLLEARELDHAAPSSQSATDPFDTSVYFERWLQDLHADRNPLTSESANASEAEASGIYIGSFPGSNCEVTFEGVLHFDGYSIGNISSPDGTLVLTSRGRIEADINVRVAVINGWVTGDITGTDRVVLESEARVIGQIYTRALSVRLGAIFDGDCLFSTPALPSAPEESSVDERSGERKYRAAAAGA
jgi:cytoskeletal protein CcmA (bactofilin family)